MKLNTPQRLLNEHEVADSCSISVLTLRKWRSQKRGPQFVKIGALVRYRPEDVDAWIAGQSIYVCMSSSELHTLQKAFREAGGHWSTFVIWAKNTFTMGRSDYQRQYEPILYGWKEGTDHFWCGARDQGDVWFVKKPVKNDLHATMKPVELVERALRNSSKTRDTVLDPFGGSGTTLIACEKAGRPARVIELEPHYCDVIAQRYIEFTGKPVLLHADGRTFEQVQQSRSVTAA